MIMVLLIRKVKKEDINEIISEAESHEINMIDTAPDYKWC